jgi:hypothetical protein
LTLVIALPASAVSSTAQARRLDLKPASATHPEEFSTVSSTRELSDGRLLVIDGRERRIVALNFVDGGVKAVGRRGKGPGEYEFPTPFRSLGGDSSLMADPAQRRLLLLDGDSIVDVVPPDHPVIVAGEGFAFGADASRRIHITRRAPYRDGSTVTGREDSTYHVLIPWDASRQDTVARTMNMPMRIERSSRPDGTISFISGQADGVLRVDEAVLLFRDGWLAVARLDPFRVDWRGPTGNWLRGRPLPIEPIRVTAREREAHQGRYGQPAPARAPGAPVPPPPAPTAYPEFLPPFVFNGLQPGPRGELLIRRQRSADRTGTDYLVIDRRGTLVGEIMLPANETIVGAGPSALYVSVRDEDDILRIRKHPWP